MRPTHFFAPLLLLAALSPAWAQQRPAVQPGARVRLTAPNAGIHKHVGTLLAVGRDTLVVDSLRVARAAVTRLYVRRGRRPNARKGALIGAGVGIGCGGIAGFMVGALCHSNPSGGGCRAGVTALGAGVFGAVGAGIGALIGRSKAERWEVVPLDQLRVSVVPLDRGMALTVSARF